MLRDNVSSRSLLPIAAVIAVGMSLRGPITAVSPILTDIQSELDVSAASAGLLTTLPVLCFALVSPLVAAVTKRTGVDAAITLSLVVLIIAVALRPWAGFGLMLVTTLLIGAAIALGNVLVPVVVRRDFPERPGPMLSASTTSLIVSATIPAALTAPLASAVGWRAALALWAALTVPALVLWIAATRDAAPAAGKSLPLESPALPVWSRLTAWELGLFFGLQALLFYATTAWLPTILQDDAGFDATTAGTAMSTYQLLGIAGAVTVPVLAARSRIRYALVVVLAAMWIALFAGLLHAPDLWPLWCTLGGLTQGGCLALGISLIALRSTSSQAARGVSAMVQTLGYAVAASGPLVIGALSALADGWTLPIYVLIALSVACGVLGVRAATSQPVA
ncbi:MFS transporter [Actinobacteria bacterium YIM 96077]|uniref:MFS transporter n=1 Tax=Phytoactinopolyspora halophila TaxID=1981511 RepID=A0A329R0A6_9ACTN|nr:MFS transporter [Phytoactinopolyspora halophila]AYY11569.1 MFS transporter [Actinobacteria bacterium YIM 96077]RAW17947.1 MFS transporter [Phytoactinopolyspora halophila]